jgi:hypothetical protein
MSPSLSPALPLWAAAHVWAAAYPARVPGRQGMSPAHEVARRVRVARGDAGDAWRRPRLEAAFAELGARCEALRIAMAEVDAAPIPASRVRIGGTWSPHRAVFLLPPERSTTERDQMALERQRSFARADGIGEAFAAFEAAIHADGDGWRVTLTERGQQAICAICGVER